MERERVEVRTQATRCPFCHECQPHPSSRRRTWS